MTCSFFHFAVHLLTYLIQFQLLVQTESQGLQRKEWSWKKKRWEAYRLWKASYFNGYDYSHAMPIPACVLSVIRYRFTDPRDDLSFTGTFRIDDGVFAGREFAIDSYY